MNSRAFIVVICISAFWILTGLRAEGSSASLSSKGTAAVDAKGVRHSANYPGKQPPWMADRIRTVAPDYPYSERAQHHVGTGYFQLTLDVKTGLVTKVTVAKSTG